MIINIINALNVSSPASNSKQFLKQPEENVVTVRMK